MRLVSLKLKLASLWYDSRAVILTLCLLCCILTSLFFLRQTVEDYSIKKWSEGCKSLDAVPHVIEGNRFCIMKENRNEQSN